MSEKPKGDLKDADGVFVESGELHLEMEWLSKGGSL